MGTEKLEKYPAVRELKERYPQAVSEAGEFRGEVTIVVPREHLRAAAEFLVAHPELQFSLLCEVTALDRYPIEPRFEVVYHLVSMEKRMRLRLKVKVSGKDAVVPSVTPVWPGANWHEREMFDLFGIRFEGHPDLTRILMPDDWEGYPLRRDYPTEGYR